MDWILSQLKHLGGHHHRDHDEQMHLFHLVFVIQLAVQSSLVLIHRGQQFSFADSANLSAAVLLGAYIVILLWLFRGRMLAPVAFALLLLTLWSLLRSLPDAPMAPFLAVYVTSVVFLVRDDGAERSLGMGSLRWICAMGWIWFGLQKLLHGHYFDGQYLAWQIATNPDSHLLFSRLVDARALQELSILQGAVDSGPYSDFGLRMNIASNGVWILQILVGMGLIYWKTRPTAVIVGFVLLLASVIGYGEVFSGLLLFNLLLLYASPAYHRAGVVVIIFTYAAILAGALGVIPQLVPPS